MSNCLDDDSLFFWPNWRLSREWDQPFHPLQEAAQLLDDDWDTQTKWTHTIDPNGMFMGLFESNQYCLTNRDIEKL